MKNKLSARLAFLLSVASILLLAPLPSPDRTVQAQTTPDSFAAQQRQSLTNNPAGVNLTLRTIGDKKQFKMGEIINLELGFASTLRDTYKLNNGMHDRSGRQEIDSFHLDPQAGVVDPLHDYFSTGNSHSLGGPFGLLPLEDKPYSITRELNEWVQFTKPGRYRLYVTSKRVGKAKADDDSVDVIAERPLSVTSNIIEFEIVAGDNAWQQHTLVEAIAILDVKDDHPENWRHEEARRVGCRKLRFLATQAAAREMAARFGSSDHGCEYEYLYGLIGSPYRAFAIKEMEQQIGAPEYPVTPMFLYTLAHLVSYGQKAITTPYPANDPEKLKQWQQQNRQQREAYEAIEAKYIEQLAAAVSRKQESARAVSLHTLLDYYARIPREKRSEFNLAWLKQLGAALPEVFFSLPPDTQSNLLGYQWKYVSNPAMLPILRQIYNTSQHIPHGLRESALRRLYELSPAEGRKLILDEIRSSHPQVSMKVLGMLPDKTLPEADEALATHLAESVADRKNNESDDAYNRMEILSLLVERYATGAVSSQVKATYMSADINSWGCLPQGSLLIYLTRQDAAAGVQLVRDVLAARDPKRSHCYASVVAGVAEEYMPPELEQLAIETLADSDAEVVASTARSLGAHGSSAAEQQLWRRLEQWHQEWRGRESELRDQASADDTLAQPYQIEVALVDALGMASAWLTDSDGLKRLQQLSLSAQGRREVARIIAQQNGTIRVTLNEEDDQLINIGVNQYEFRNMLALKEKLKQYPRGTAFIWNTLSRHSPAAERLFAELKAYLEERGIRLTK